MKSSYATEQDIRKPKDKRDRKSFYSGRKKKHTVKTRVTIERKDGLILDASSGWEGRRYDFLCLKHHVWMKGCPKRVQAWTDKGYIGIKERFSGREIERSKKKPKERDLTDEEKEFNLKVNKVRVMVEHRILAMKRFRVMGGLYRGRRKGYEMNIQVVAGLVNF